MMIAILVVAIACLVFWLVFLKLKLLRMTPGWVFGFSVFVVHLLLVFVIEDALCVCCGSKLEHDEKNARLNRKSEQFFQRHGCTIQTPRTHYVLRSVSQCKANS